MYDLVFAMLFEEEPTLEWKSGPDFVNGWWFQGWPPTESPAIRRHGWHFADPVQGHAACGSSGGVRHSAPFPGVEHSSGLFGFGVRERHLALCDMCEASAKGWMSEIPIMDMPDQAKLLKPSRAYWMVQSNLCRAAYILNRIEVTDIWYPSVRDHLRAVLEPISEDLFRDASSDRKASNGYHGYDSEMKIDRDHQRLWNLITQRLENS